ncbi:MAG: histidine kinase [Vicinamibacterales bacterium]|nr:histidine kinase [Vicinamibacterales bacterium]
MTLPLAAAAPEAAARARKRLGARRAAVFAGGLSLLSVFTAVHMYVVYRERMPIGWAEALLSGFATWYPWLLLGPGVAWLARRFPFEPERWRWSVLVHVPASVLFGALHGVLRWAVGPLVDSRPIPIDRIIIGQLLLTVLSYFVLVAAFQAVVNYRRYRERELRASQLEARLAQAQLEMLRMQLHPHFLFNTLHAISTLMHRDPEAADEMVAQLSDLLRMTLDNIGKQEVTLREELDFLQRYLDIQHTRFQDRLRVTLDIRSDTLDARVPNQLLQPLVENAIRHGLDGRPAGGSIAIAARLVGEALQVTIRDDGEGVRTGTARPEGIGLGNTRARLTQLYGPGASLELANHWEGGAIVTVVVPQGAAPADRAPRDATGGGA